MDATNYLSAGNVRASWHATTAATASAWPLWWDDEAPPTLGVREPRKPSPPTLSGGATAELYFAPEREAEARAQGARLDGPS